MGAELPLEIRWEAEELYIVDGLTFEQVAEKTGVSVSQLKRWAAGTDEAPSWSARREEYRQSMQSIRRDTVLLRAKLIQKAMKSLDPQDVYAVARLEKATAKVLTSEAQYDVDPPGGPVNIASPADAVNALRDVIERKMSAMLAHPEKADLANIKKIKEALELVEKMAQKAGMDGPDPDKGMDADTLREISERIKLL